MMRTSGLSSRGAASESGDEDDGLREAITGGLAASSPAAFVV
jgi:hypothetical protein